jgi:hypothetical protein
MSFSKKRFSIEEIKEIDIVDYLSRLGHHPTKIRNADHWCLSPLRNEKTASFKVNRKIDRWYDHELGKSSNIINFGTLYDRCTMADFLQNIDTNLSFHQPVLYPSNQPEQEHKITILEDVSTRSFALTNHIEERKIPLAIAGEFCREVRYNLNKKIYYAIGFKNNSGCYKIRNPCFKASSSTKDVTTFHHGAKEVSVFEGLTDSLSFMVLHQIKRKTATNFLVLNSVSLFEKARPFMEQHKAVHLYL